MERIDKIKNVLEKMCKGIKPKVDANRNNVDYTQGYNHGFDTGYNNALMYVIDLICMDEEELNEEIDFIEEVYNDEE